MSPPAFQRFSGLARVVHWLIAMPYLTLLASGGLILLHHLGWINTPPVSLLASIHRWTGLAFAAIVLDLVLAALLGGQLKAAGRELGGWFVLRPRDLRWLMRVPFNAFLPRRIPLPPAGRFNAGQKLHGVFILIAVTGFIITGLIMIWLPGWLKIWLIHACLFFGAAAFLGLHLFLALVNPATRPALGGIFTGRVPQAYVRDHHPLVLKELPVGRDHRAAVSIGAMILVMLPIAGGIFFWWRGPGESVVRATISSSRKNAIISPGALVSAHSLALYGDRCDACHTSSGPTKNDACLDCHAEIRKVIDHRAGYHGTLTGECAACHVEHHGADADLRHFDPRTFNHQLAGFPLIGAHRSLNCDQCHVLHSPKPGQRRYIGIKSSVCADCHSNPHADMPAADCKQCHDEQGWKGRNLLFIHNRDSHFKLDATHSVLSCSSCHRQTGSSVVFRGLPTTCAQCHTQIASAMAGKMEGLTTRADPHDSRVACVECHDPQLRSSTPAQYAAQCARCHGVRYRTLFFNWQKSLDEREQSARERLRQQAGADSRTKQSWSDRLEQAHAAGMHNMQQAIEAFEKTGR